MDSHRNQTIGPVGMENTGEKEESISPRNLAFKGRGRPGGADDIEWYREVLCNSFSTVFLLQPNRMTIVHKDS